MIINPKEIVEKGIVENVGEGKFEVQQNGIDLTIESLSIVNGGTLGRDERVIRDYTPLEPTENGYWILGSDRCYSIMFEQKVSVPDNMCASIVQRSTLNRMGGFILSGLYDSGFSNVIGAILRTSAPIRIQKGARVAQIVFQEASPASLYKGIYNAK